MKKKLMIVAVLLGALSLGACVDDNESQSVTNVRNSKTAELKSIAAMEKAAAEAKLTMSTAEAKLKLAEAEAQQAAAAKALAEAELEKKQAELIALQKEAAEIENEAARIENERRQAILEAEMAQLEVDKKLAEERLAQIAAEMDRLEKENEAALLETQLALKMAEQALAEAQKDLDNAKTDAEREKIEAERQKLQDRAAAYSNAVNDLITAQNSLLTLKGNLARLESGLTTMQDAKDAQIAENNNNIALNKMYIEQYQKYTNYTEDVTALRNQLNTLVSEANRLHDVRLAKQQAYYDVSADMTAVNEADKAMGAEDFYRFITNRGAVYLKDADGNEKGYHLGVAKYLPNSYKYSSPKWYTYKADEDEYMENLGDSIYLKVGELYVDFRTVELYVNEQINNNETSLKSSEKSLKYNQAQYNGKATTVIGSDGEGNDILKPIRNAVDSTAYLKKQLDAAETAEDKAEYTRLYKESIDNEEKLLDNIDCYGRQVEDYTLYIKALKLGWEMYQNYDANVADLQKKMDARNEECVKAYEAKVAAWRVYMDAYIAWQKVYSEYNAVRSLLYDTYIGDLNGNGEDDADEYLLGAAAINAQIERYKAEIEAWEAENADLSGIQTQEALIADMKAKIAAKEIVVKAREVAVAAAKAALDEVMPKEGE